MRGDGMTLGEFAILVLCLALAAAYVGLCVWAWRKAEGVPLERYEEDERAQRRRY